ncbi:hypothetical protein [Pseudomonas taetrolens]|uniref:hypothetical protein n=1 Tax=Pseudomonas taetrolens TaxID=47884 RepID=UPI003F97228D
MASSRIEIKFVCGANKKKLFSGNAVYRSSNARCDVLRLYNKIVIIESSRTTTNPNPLKQHNSTFYKQIVKAICLYYVMEQKPRPIREIAITQYLGSPREKYQSLGQKDLKQVVSRGADLTVLQAIAPPKAALLLEETVRGRAVLYAITHLIRSLDSNSPFDRFERLWRAFNALYRALAKKSSDHDCHVVLRDHIQKSPQLFPLSLQYVSSLTTSKIRPHLRWNQMLQNNHATVKKAKMLHDSIMRVEDHRILEIYRDSLSVRTAHLNQINAMPPILSHIALHTGLRTIRDSDVLSTLCVKYMYFVRNKIAHAERADHGFSFLLGSAEEVEIQWLIPILEMLVIDLVNISDTF